MVCPLLTCHKGIMVVWSNIFCPYLPKKVPANTCALCLNIKNNMILKRIIIHCTKARSSVCKQVYWAAFCLHVAVLFYYQNVCSRCIGIKSRWLASALCHMFKKKFYRKQIALFVRLVSVFMAIIHRKQESVLLNTYINIYSICIKEKTWSNEFMWKSDIRDVPCVHTWLHI